MERSSHDGGGFCQIYRF